MHKDFSILIAGFGGQGILFAGKVLANAGLQEKREVSWLPSYGPEMRGGTANCSVCISDLPIGCPLVTKPNILIVMNGPSLTRFINDVETGGMVLVDSFLVSENICRKDLSVCYIPATKLAEEHKIAGLANMILLGKLLKETSVCSISSLKIALESCIPSSKRSMMDSNKKAVEIGLSY